MCALRSVAPFDELRHLHGLGVQLVRFGQLGVEPRSRSASSRLAPMAAGEVLLPAYTRRAASSTAQQARTERWRPLGTTAEAAGTSIRPKVVLELS